jgi:hypothetical protein
MAHRSHPARRRHSRISCASCGHVMSSQSSLVEHVCPGEDPAYIVEQLDDRASDHGRFLIIAANVGVHVLALIGLFVLIAVGQPGERLLVWQSAMMVAGGAFSASITNYYFPRHGSGGAARPRSGRARQVTIEPPAPVRQRSVAIIGSFRQFYPEVCRAAAIFSAAGLTVTAPAISTVVNGGAKFVRFAVDPPSTSDEELQERALARILSADVVYVVAPGGYIGLTTSYELGQVQLRRIPVFYSHSIADLPITIPAGAVWEASALAAALAIEPDE